MNLSQAISEAPSIMRRKRLPRRLRQLTLAEQPVSIERARQLFKQIKLSLYQL